MKLFAALFALALTSTVYAGDCPGGVCPKPAVKLFEHPSKSVSVSVVRSAPAVAPVRTVVVKAQAKRPHVLRKLNARRPHLGRVFLGR